MVDIPSLRKEARYGMPAADQILFNRYYVLGYSYYFRQVKWALEISNHDLSVTNQKYCKKNSRHFEGRLSRI